MKNSAKLNIDLNAKTIFGVTAFHYACRNGHAKIAEMIMKNSTEFNIDLNTKCDSGVTAFHYASYHGSTSIVDVMIHNSESLKIDLTPRDHDDETGFQDCDCENCEYCVSAGYYHYYSAYTDRF